MGGSRGPISICRTRFKVGTKEEAFVGHCVVVNRIRTVLGRAYLGRLVVFLERLPSAIRHSEVRLAFFRHFFRVVSLLFRWRVPIRRIFVSQFRIRVKECASQGFVGHPRGYVNEDRVDALLMVIRPGWRGGANCLRCSGRRPMVMFRGRICWVPRRSRSIVLSR